MEASNTTTTGRWSLRSTHHLGDEATVSVIEERVHGLKVRIWTLVATPSGLDALVDPKGTAITDPEWHAKRGDSTVASLLAWLPDAV